MEEGGMTSHPHPDDQPTPSSPRIGQAAGCIAPATSIADAFNILSAAATGEALKRVRELGSSSEPEVLHKLRVALRRLRTLWWVFQPLLDKQDAKFHCSEFKSLAAAAGKTRDWDVLRALLSTAPSSESFGALIARVDRQRSSALAFSNRIIANAGVERIIEHAVLVARNQIEARTAPVRLDEFATTRAERAETMLKKRVKRVVSHQNTDYAELHEIRIAGKRLRYSLEFLAPVLDGHYLATIEQLAQVQQQLGDLNDLVTSETLLREYEFQLGESRTLKKAIKYLDEQQRVRKIVAHDMLRARF
jgi:CHAD domain-containing protein